MQTMAVWPGANWLVCTVFVRKKAQTGAWFPVLVLAPLLDFVHIRIVPVHHAPQYCEGPSGSHIAVVSTATQLRHVLQLAGYQCDAVCYGKHALGTSWKQHTAADTCSAHVQLNPSDGAAVLVL
jgi:hypothetical protein